MISLSALAELIRKEGSITKGNLYKNCKLSYSVFYKLCPLIDDVFEDIMFDRIKQKFTCRNISLSLFFREADK